MIFFSGESAHQQNVYGSNTLQDLARSWLDDLHTSRLPASSYVWRPKHLYMCGVAISWSKYCPLACAKITFCASSYWAAPGTQKIDPLVVLRCRSSSPDLFHLVWSWSFLSIFSQELRPLAPSLGKLRWTNILKDQFRLKHQNYWTEWSTPSTPVINLWSPAIRRLVNCAQGFFQFAALLAKDPEIYARSKCFQKSGILPVPKSTKATYRLWSVKPLAFLQNPPAEPAAYLLAAASVLSRRGWAERKDFYSMETFSEHIFSMPSFKHLLYLAATPPRTWQTAGCSNIKLRLPNNFLFPLTSLHL